MKKFVFLLAFTMLLKPVIPVFQYIFNYDYIANELCINKDNLVMGCNGKCYLVKELAKASETEKPLSSDKKHTIIETTDLFLPDSGNYDLTAFQILAQKQVNTTYSDLYSHLSSHSFFHPPTIIS